MMMVEKGRYAHPSAPPIDTPFDLVVVGEVNPDLILRGDVTPAFGQVEQLVEDATLTIGSSSAIFACGAARLGLRVAFIGTVGDDVFGQFMRRELAEHSIDVSGIVVDPAIRTGLSVILSRDMRGAQTRMPRIGKHYIRARPRSSASRSSTSEHLLSRGVVGKHHIRARPRSSASRSSTSEHLLSRGVDRAILTYAGAIGALRYDQIDHARLARARHLHLGSYFLLDALRPDIPQLFAAAHELGLMVSIDTNYDPSGRWDGGLDAALRHVDVFLPNQAELLVIAGASDVDAALEAMARRVPLVGVKLGARGAAARRGAELARAAALPVDVVDTTGAGDSFDAGFIYGCLHGWDLARTLRLACACGSLSARAAGGTAAQPSLEEALAFAEETANRVD